MSLGAYWRELRLWREARRPDAELARALEAFALELETARDNLRAELAELAPEGRENSEGSGP